MAEEDDPEWKAFHQKCMVFFPNKVMCKYCRKTLITDEFTSHLIHNHKKEAKETKKDVKARLDWEKKANNINEDVLKKLV